MCRRVFRKARCDVSALSSQGPSRSRLQATSHMDSHAPQKALIFNCSGAAVVHTRCGCVYSIFALLRRAWSTAFGCDNHFETRPSACINHANNSLHCAAGHIGRSACQPGAAFSDNP